MQQHWERLAEAQRIRQEIEAEFQEALSQLGRDAADRARRAGEGARGDRVRVDHPPRLR